VTRGRVPHSSVEFRFSAGLEKRGNISRPWKIQSHTCAGVRLMTKLFCHSQTSTAARQRRTLRRRSGPAAAQLRQPDSCAFPATVAEVRTWVAGKPLVGGASQHREHKRAGAVAPAHKKPTAGPASHAHNSIQLGCSGCGAGSWRLGWPRSHERGYARGFPGIGRGTGCFSKAWILRQE
jgi:hypothetical protein